MAKGRPKNPRKAQNRIMSIVLNEKAFLIFQEVCKKREDKRWIHRYVSEHIIRDFENGSEAFILHQLLETQKDRDKIVQEYEKKISELAKTYSEIKSKRNIERIKKEIEKEKEIIGVRT